MAQTTDESMVVQAFEYSGDVQHGVPPSGGDRLPQAGGGTSSHLLKLSMPLKMLL